MTVLSSLGQREAARDVYRQCAAVLDRELGVAPGPQTQALYQRVLRT